jgi:hypothetical protein
MTATLVPTSETTVETIPAVPDYDPVWLVTDEDFAIFAHYTPAALTQLALLDFVRPMSMLTARCLDERWPEYCPLGVVKQLDGYGRSRLPGADTVADDLHARHGRTLDPLWTEAARFINGWDGGRIDPAALRVGIKRLLARLR